MAAICYNCEYEDRHESTPLTIDAKIESHIVNFDTNFEQEGDFLWEFGDDLTSTSHNPIHIYDTMGQYEIKLSIIRNNVIYKTFTFISIDGLEDIEGNIYSTIRLGNQLWMTENLAATTCSDNTLIDTSHYRILENGMIGYNYLALEQCNICPAGWRVPNEQDIDNLRFLERPVDEVERLLNVSREGFGGDYIRVQGFRIYYGDFRYAIENTFSWRTTQGDKQDYAPVRCIKVL